MVVGMVVVDMEEEVVVTAAVAVAVVVVEERGVQCGAHTTLVGAVEWVVEALQVMIVVHMGAAAAATIWVGSVVEATDRISSSNNNNNNRPTTKHHLRSNGNSSISSNTNSTNRHHHHHCNRKGMVVLHLAMVLALHPRDHSNSSRASGRPHRNQAMSRTHLSSSSSSDMHHESKRAHMIRDWLPNENVRCTIKMCIE